jgi:hypothetical protein
MSARGGDLLGVLGAVGLGGDLPELNYIRPPRWPCARRCAVECLACATEASLEAFLCEGATDEASGRRSAFIRDFTRSECSSAKLNAGSLILKLESFLSSVYFELTLALISEG